MKVIIVALAFVAVAAAAAIADEQVQILKSDNEQQPDGSYIFRYETEDGITREQNGEIKTVQNEEDKPQNVVVVKGSWSYTDPEGNLETVSFFADENGYHADGPSIPKVASR